MTETFIDHDYKLLIEKEIEKVFGISPGIIGSGRKEFNKDIVVGNVQTLYKVFYQVNSALLFLQASWK